MTKINYAAAVVGDVIWMDKRENRVTDIKRWVARGGNITKLFFDNGDDALGWNDKELNLV